MTSDIDGKSLDVKAQKLAQLKELYPELFTENRLDLKRIKELLSEDQLAGTDRYELSWAAKDEARREIQRQTSATVTPDASHSVDFETTENIFIEGENLEVLRVFQKAYFGKVKLIYIDPPYNTGKDSFIYPDDYSERREEYEKRVGKKADDGFLNKLDLYKKNVKENGQYHSVWLSMMYPRLYLARNLLREDGVILVSIDDNEQANLKLLMNEVFGEENFVGQIVIQTATDNNPTQVATEHEYILCYSKNMAVQSFWTRKSEAADRIQTKYLELKKKHKKDTSTIQTELRQWIRQNKDELPRVTHYDNVDDKGVFHDGDVANTIFGGYKYDVIHPITKKVCKVPEKGFRFPEETMKQMLKDDNILFGTDETTLIKPKIRLENAKDSLRSIIYEDGRASTKVVDQLLGRGVFDNPKSHTVLKRLIDFVTDSKDDIVLDFFAGSGSTAHAVIELNADDGGSRRFICVQLPEPCEPDSPATKAGYSTIADICRSRIQKVFENLPAEQKTSQSEAGVFGVRSYKLVGTNFKQWNGLISTPADLLKQIESFQQPLSLTPSDSYGLLVELLLKSGYPLSVKTEKKVSSDKTPYYLVNDDTVFALDSISNSLLSDVEKLGVKALVVLSGLFQGAKADELMNNWKLQLEEAGIDFKKI